MTLIVILCLIVVAYLTFDKPNTIKYISLVLIFLAAFMLLKSTNFSILNSLKLIPYQMAKDTKIIKSFGTVLTSKPEVKKLSMTFQVVVPSSKRTIPDSFPSNDMTSPEWAKYLSFLSPIGNQGACGSCWAFSTAGVLSDRFSLLSAGKIKPILSPGKMVICTFGFENTTQDRFDKWWQNKKYTKNTKTHGSIACNGNNLYSACNVLYAFGTVEESCVPYNSTDYPNIKLKYNLGQSNDPANIPYCGDVMSIDNNKDMMTCADQTTAPRIYRADDVFAISPAESDIMKEIYKWGSVSAGFNVFSNFMDTYDGKTIYMGPNKNDTDMGGHAIKIVGWGSENNVPYWWIANSWSSNWGMSGYFRMKRMIKECELEQNVVSMMPQFPGKTLWNLKLNSVLPTSGMFRDNPNRQIDTDLMYYNSDIALIKSGKLTGDLNPIITSDKLPNGGDYDNFWVADLVSDSS